MNEIFLLKLGEIVLKGQNRRTFEDKLRQNVRRRVARFGNFKVYIMQSTVYVEPQEEACDVDGAWDACGAIFGVSSMCRCRACEKDLDAIFKTVVSYLGDELGFPVEVKQDVYSSDSTPFADKGVPAVSFARIAPHNTATIHNSYDTLALMKGEQMEADIAFLIAFVTRMANAVRCPVAREIPDNMKEKLDIYLCRKRAPK